MAKGVSPDGAGLSPTAEPVPVSSAVAASIPDALICDVCAQHEAKGVGASSLGPVSWAYCADCLSANAEPAVMFDATLDGCGGAESVADWVRRINTYVDGKYVGFDEYAKSRDAT